MIIIFFFYLERCSGFTSWNSAFRSLLVVLRSSSDGFKLRTLTCKSIYPVCLFFWFGIGLYPSLLTANSWLWTQWLLLIGLRNHMWCCRANPSWMYVRQVPYILSSLSLAPSLSYLFCTLIWTQVRVRSLKSVFIFIVESLKNFIKIGK